MNSIPVLSLKLILFSWITAKRQLIHNRTAQRDIWNQSYDFIVVGAGTSGCVVATRLAENPNVNVLVLEAGGPQDAIYTDIPALYPSISMNRPDLYWYFDTEPDSFTSRRMRITRGKLIGGTSTIGAMGYLRPQQRDFDNWVTNYGAKGWSFREVLPFFIRFENNTDWNTVYNNPGYHGIGGPVQITTPKGVDPIFLIFNRVFNELGFKDTDINGANQTGFVIEQAYSGLNGFRTASGNAYIDPNPHPNNLHIVTRAQVLRVLFNKTTAIGVEFNRFDTSYRVFARREVILCAGPYNSPQLLMLSGIGPKDNLQAFGIPVIIDLPVGSNAVPYIGMILTLNVKSGLINPAPQPTIDNLSQLYLNQSGPLSRFVHLIIYFSTKYNLDLDWPNCIIVVNANNGQLNYQLEMFRMRSRGFASLQSSSPYIGLKINPNIFFDPRDFDDSMAALKFLLFVVERTPLAQYVTLPTFESVGCQSCPGRYMYECDDGIRCYILTQYIVNVNVGMCRLGAVVRNDTVVDPLMLVKNAYNLRVCDSSVNPIVFDSTAIQLMLGERCAQFIKDCYDLN